MSERKGLLQTCDRCGANLFRALIGKNEFDGGYTVLEKYEPDPDGWNYHTETGLLCPACNAEYTEMIIAFMEAGRQKPDGA